MDGSTAVRGVVAEGTLQPVPVPFTTAPAGAAAITVPSVAQPLAATLEARLIDGGSAREVRNAWKVWLFPRTEAPAGVDMHGDATWSWLRHWHGILPSAATGPGKLMLTERLDAELVDFMRRGGRILLAAGEGLVRPYGPLFGYVKYFFTPPANYPPYEDGQNGTVIADHPMLHGFPHGGYADWQFFRLMDNAPPLDLEPVGLADGDPIIRVIHRYQTLHPLGYLVERRVGLGALLLCALELDPDWIEARWLLAQFCRCAASDAWAPAMELTATAQARLVPFPSREFRVVNGFI